MEQKKIGEVFLTGLFLDSLPSAEESVFIPVDECDEENVQRMTMLHLGVYCYSVYAENEVTEATNQGE